MCVRIASRSRPDRPTAEARGALLLLSTRPAAGQLGSLARASGRSYSIGGQERGKEGRKDTTSLQLACSCHSRSIVVRTDAYGITRSIVPQLEERAAKKKCVRTLPNLAKIRTKQFRSHVLHTRTCTCACGGKQCNPNQTTVNIYRPEIICTKNLLYNYIIRRLIFTQLRLPRRQCERV